MSDSCNAAERVDPALVGGWLTARSIARGLPAPVVVPGGWRVETGGPVEWQRYVFANATPEIALLARSIDRPGIYLKLCRDNDDLRSMLPAGWSIDAMAWMMTGPGRAAPAVLPSGYASEVTRTGATILAKVLAPNGQLAASGYAAEAGGVFVYDRIVTQPEHQRRGLGTTVMALLGDARRDPTSRSVLVATAAGRVLYEKLGWSVVAPYASAVKLPAAA